MADHDEVDMAPIANETQEIARIEGVIAEMKQHINRNNANAALKHATAAFPPDIKDENTRKAIADVMATALTSLDKAAIDLYISQSSSDERATVMKYVCRCMADGDRRTCDTLLAWHAKLVEKDGHGIILRVMTERRV